MGSASRRQWVYRSATALLAAFCLFEAIKHGWAATLTIAIFILLPDVVLITGSAPGRPLARRRIAAYKVAHSYWPPLILVGLSLLGWPELWLRSGLEIFLAGLAWAIHVTAVRAFGFHSRTWHDRQRVGVEPV